VISKAMDNKWDYNKIMSDKNLFNKTVYTSLSEAIKILKKRQKDKKLKENIEKLLENDIPEPLTNIGQYAINGKQIATPNFDTRCFLSAIEGCELKPLFYEYYSDKFTSNNDFKHSLGQLIIYKDNKRNSPIEERITIVDFNKYDGKKLFDVKTIWNEPLRDFHHKLFDTYGYNTKDFIFYDGSGWLNRNGKKAVSFYEKDLLLYVYHGILFENFLLSGSDGNFTKNTFLPAFEKVYRQTGLKPLIVPIPPMDKELEESSRWYSYSEKIKPLIIKNKK